MASGWDIPLQGDLGVQHRINPVNDKWAMKAVTVTGRLPETDQRGEIPDPGQNQLVPLHVDTFANLRGEVVGQVPETPFVLPPMDRMDFANAPPQYPVPPIPGTNATQTASTPVNSPLSSANTTSAEQALQVNPQAKLMTPRQEANSLANSGGASPGVTSKEQTNVTAFSSSASMEEEPVWPAPVLAAIIILPIVIVVLLALQIYVVVNARKSREATR
jgi:hypothetical protein